jgi:hypothetical protein
MQDYIENHEGNKACLYVGSNKLQFGSNLTYAHLTS